MYFDIHEATVLCGYEKTSTMINYLCREGLITPSSDHKIGKGRKRYFTYQDLLILKMYRKLLNAGLSVKKIKNALDETKEFKKMLASPEEIKYRSTGLQYLFTDGEKVYFYKDQQQAIEMGTKGQYIFSFILDLILINRELADNVKSLEVARNKKNYKSRYLNLQQLAVS